jgi:hypothetical protein
MEGVVHILEKLSQNISPDQITGFLKQTAEAGNPPKNVPAVIATKPASLVNVFQSIGTSTPVATNVQTEASENTPFASPYAVPSKPIQKINKVSKAPKVPKAIPLKVPEKEQPLFPFSVDDRTMQFANAFFKYFENPAWVNQHQDNVAIYYTFYQGLIQAFKSHSPLIPTVNVQDNIYYIGPICGSLEDLRLIIGYFEKVLIQVPETKIVFLGHYFHSIEHAIEAFTYLMSFKCLHPDNIFILRGSTENEQYFESMGFLTHLTKSFDKYAKVIYDQICEITANLDLLVIGQLEGDVRVLATGGGIPFVYRNPASLVNLSLIESSLSPRQSKRENLDEITQTILWGRPNQLEDKINADSQGNIYYSWSLLQEFFHFNNLRYMIASDPSYKNGHTTIWNQISMLFSCSCVNGKTVNDAKILRVNSRGMADLIINDLSFYLERDYQNK